MKKAIAVASILVIGIIAAIPFASGLIMEKTVRQAVEAMNAMNASSGADYSLKIIHYDRGYRTSDIIWKINLGSLRAICPIEEIIFRDHAEHGITGVVSTTSLNNNPWYAYFVADNLLGRDPVRITTHFGFGGGIESTLDLDAFMIPVGDDTIDVKAGRIVTQTDRALKTFISSGTWAGLSAGDNLSIGALSLDSNLTRFSTFIWDGTASFALEDLQARMAIDHLHIESVEGGYSIGNTDNRTMVSAEARLSIDGLRSNKRNVDSASVHIDMNGLEADGYASFLRLYTQNMTQLLGNLQPPDEGPLVTQAAMSNKGPAPNLRFLAACENLLKAGLELNISNLHVELDDGIIEGGAALRLLQDVSLMQFPLFINQPGLLLDMLNLESLFKLPSQWVDANPRLTIPLYPGMQTGLFVQQGDDLIHQAKTVDGRLMLNGKEVFLAK